MFDDYCPNCDSEEVDSYNNGDQVCRYCGHCWNSEEDE